MNDEWSNPYGFAFAKKKVEFGVVEKDLVSLIEVLPGYELIMPLLQFVFCNFLVEVGVIPQLF